MDYAGAMASTAGYSGTSLVRKLGFKPGWRVLLVDAPDHYLDLLGGAEDLSFVDGRGEDASPADAAHVFLHHAGDAAGQSRAAIARLRAGGLLWLSWTKKSSPIHLGLTEDMLRDAVLPLGWVDVKVCAVDTDWSGLKFLKRKEKSG